MEKHSLEFIMKDFIFGNEFTVKVVDTRFFLFYFLCLFLFIFIIHPVNL